MTSHEDQGTAYDPHATGHELQGRVTKEQGKSMTATPRFKSFTGRRNAHAAVAKSPARSIRYSTPLEAVTLRDGSKSLQYVPTFKPATEAERAIVLQARFRCADE